MKINAPILFTQADFDAFEDLLNQIEALVKDKLAALTPKQRSDFGAISKQTSCSLIKHLICTAPILQKVRPT